MYFLPTSHRPTARIDVLPRDITPACRRYRRTSYRHRTGLQEVSTYFLPTSQQPARGIDVLPTNIAPACKKYRHTFYRHRNRLQEVSTYFLPILQQLTVSLVVRISHHTAISAHTHNTHLLTRVIVNKCSSITAVTETQEAKNLPGNWSGRQLFAAVCHNLLAS